ncbi:hypothetical protein [Marinospirillum sp.]|uniref:hypothetical protein n=1 Tax=Marinospirillum sp. TaxID=2183934 RepID=UPI00384D69B9
MMMKNKWLAVMLLGLVIGLSGCLEEDVDNNGKYSSCEISTLFNDWSGTNYYSEATSKCWNISGGGYTSSQKALDWCTDKARDYLTDRGYTGSSFGVKVNSSSCQ